MHGGQLLWMRYTPNWIVNFHDYILWWEFDMALGAGNLHSPLPHPHSHTHTHTCSHKVLPHLCCKWMGDLAPSPPHLAGRWPQETTLFVLPWATTTAACTSLYWWVVALLGSECWEESWSGTKERKSEKSRVCWVASGLPHSLSVQDGKKEVVCTLTARSCTKHTCMAQVMVVTIQINPCWNVVLLLFPRNQKYYVTHHKYPHHGFELRTSSLIPILWEVSLGNEHVGSETHTKFINLVNDFLKNFWMVISVFQTS